MRRSILPPAALVLGPLVWSLHAQELGIVESQVEIGGAYAGLALDPGDRFGAATAALGDVDGDGIGDVAVGAPGDDDGGDGKGAVYVLFLGPGGAIASHRKISASAGGFGGALEKHDAFGSSVAGIGDLDGDGVPDLAVGAPGDDDDELATSAKKGAVWILFLNADGTVKAESRIGEGTGGFPGALDNVDLFGASVASLGDVDRDGVVDLAVGAPGDEDDGGDEGSGSKKGAVWILLLKADGTVKSAQEIGAGKGGFTGALDNVDAFGAAVAGIGDLDRDGVLDLAVGAPGDDDGGSNRGAVWVLFLNPDGSVRAQQKISASAGDFGGALAKGDRFGAGLARLDELDPDDRVDLAVGAPGDGSERGAVWVLFLQSDGTVEDWTKIGDAQGGFTGALAQDDAFGSGIAAVGDLDGNGVHDLLAGAPGAGDEDGGDDGPGTAGAGWTLFLREGAEQPFYGSGINPGILQPGAQPPVIGKVWDPVVLEPGEGKSIFHFLGTSTRGAGFMLPGESAAFEVLISLLPGEYITCMSTPPGTPFQVPIPDNPMLIGFEVFAQGGFMAATGAFELTNRLDVVIGL
jgi:hypothetical protein